jgi:hypothetical protein
MKGMNIATQRNNIVHRVLDITDLKLLKEIEELLDKNVFSYTTSGKALSVKEYKNHLDKIRFFPKWNYKIVYRIEIIRIYILDVFSRLQDYRKIKI